MAFGSVDPTLLTPIPVWNPLEWNVGWVSETLSAARARRRPVGRVRAHVRVRGRLARDCASRSAIRSPTTSPGTRRGTKTLLLILLILPLWISYLMRMLAWVNLLAPDGYVNRFLDVGARHQPAVRLARRPSPITVIFALVYGYIPYLILPLFASLDRIDKSLMEAARDLGASPLRTFLHVTLPLSKTGILGGCVLIALPMFGDYYTPNIVSGAPTTSMLGNQIDLYFHCTSQPTIGAALTILLSALPGGPDGLLHGHGRPGDAGSCGG